MPDEIVVSVPAAEGSPEAAAAAAVNEASQAVEAAAAAVHEATQVQQPWESALERISQEVRASLEALRAEIANLKAPLSEVAAIQAKTALVTEQTAELLAVIAEAETIEEAGAAPLNLESSQESEDRTSPAKPRRVRPFRLV